MLKTITLLPALLIITAACAPMKASQNKTYSTTSASQIAARADQLVGSELSNLKSIYDSTYSDISLSPTTVTKIKTATATFDSNQPLNRSDLDNLLKLVDDDQVATDVLDALSAADLRRSQTSSSEQNQIVQNLLRIRAKIENDPLSRYEAESAIEQVKDAPIWTETGFRRTKICYFGPGEYQSYKATHQVPSEVDSFVFEALSEICN